jgi:hypothetical protein
MARTWGGRSGEARQFGEHLFQPLVAAVDTRAVGFQDAAVQLLERGFAWLTGELPATDCQPSTACDDLPSSGTYRARSSAIERPLEVPGKQRAGLGVHRHMQHRNRVMTDHLTPVFARTWKRPLVSLVSRTGEPAQALTACQKPR